MSDGHKLIIAAALALFCAFGSIATAQGEIEDLTILGSGPAGLSAAIYATRANLPPLCIERDQVGGQLMLTGEVENFPGFVEPIMGHDLMNAQRAQAERLGTRFLQSKVVSADLSSRPFVLQLANGATIMTRVLIIATGATAKWMGLPSEKRLMGKGVSACATCDGFFFKQRDIVVVGGGDTAMEEAIFLTRFAKSVTIVNRSSRLRASKTLQAKAMNNAKIIFLWDTEIAEILGEQNVSGVVLLDLKSREIRLMPVEGVFVAIGHEPNTSLFKSSLALDAAGYIVKDAGSTTTNVPGVFVAGDVADPVYRQAITAASTGCMAALDAERFLESGS